MQQFKKNKKIKTFLYETNKANKMTCYRYIRGLINYNTKKPRVLDPI